MHTLTFVARIYAIKPRVFEIVVPWISTRPEPSTAKKAATHCARLSDAAFGTFVGHLEGSVVSNRRGNLLPFCVKLHWRQANLSLGWWCWNLFFGWWWRRYDFFWLLIRRTKKRITFGEIKCDQHHIGNSTRIHVRPLHTAMPSANVCSKLLSPGFPHFPTQAPPRRQQLILPEMVIPH